MWNVSLCVRLDSVLVWTVSLYVRLDSVLQCGLYACMSGCTVCYHVDCVTVRQAGRRVTMWTVSLCVRLKDVTMWTVYLYVRLHGVLSRGLCPCMSGWTACYHVDCVPVC
jgi:hypothetical protein